MRILEHCLCVSVSDTRVLYGKRCFHCKVAQCLMSLNWKSDGEIQRAFHEMGGSN